MSAGSVAVRWVGTNFKGVVLLFRLVMVLLILIAFAIKLH